MLESLSNSTGAKRLDDEEVVATVGTLAEWTLRIKSFKDVDIRISSNAVVSQLKDTTRDSLGERAQGRYLRLICKGRLLQPDHAPIQEFSVKDGDVVHAVLALAQTTSNNSSSDTNRRRRRRSIVVGPGGRVTRAANRGNGDSSSDEEEGRERIGFDRLRSSGLSRQEITAIRAYFSRHVDRYAQQHSDNHGEETDLSRRRLLIEDDWMAMQGPVSEFRLNLNQNTLTRYGNLGGDPRTNRTSLGNDRDFMWGFMLGFFVGFPMIMWVWLPTIPHKQKLGILVGISFQLALDLFQEEHEDEFDQD